MKELVYTSAPAGLRPGSGGFCTVAMSDGLPAAVVEFLERFSNTYRPMYMPYDPRAGDNPVAYSLVKARPGGNPIVVLSRNGAAGTDHTGRTNNLAHHLVHDAPGPGDGSNPAATAAQGGTFLTEWDGPPRRLSARSTHGSSGPRGVCRAWEELTGDPGWAATVAAAWTGRSDGRPLYVIYPNGTDLLALLAEAISLLPADRRWDCTFTTYYTSLSPDVTCVVRGVVEGSPQEADARRGDHIDLADCVGPGPDGALADRARGKAVAEDIVLPAAAAPPLPRRSLPNEEPIALPVSRSRAVPDEPPPMRPVRGQPVDHAVEVVRPRGGGLKWAWIVTLILGPLLLITLVCGGLFSASLMGQKNEVEQQKAAAEEEAKKQKKERDEFETQLADAKAKLTEANRKLTEAGVAAKAAQAANGNDTDNLRIELARTKKEVEEKGKEIDKLTRRAETAENQLKVLQKGPMDPPVAVPAKKDAATLADVYKALDGLPLTDKLLAYVRLARDSKEAGKKIDDVVLTGQLEVVEASVKGDDKADKKVYGINRLQYGGGKAVGLDAPKLQVVGWFVSEPSASGNPNPTYLPKSNTEVHSVGPIDLHHYKALEAKSPYYLDRSKLPDEIAKDKNGDQQIVLVLKTEKGPPAGYLAWVRLKGQ